MDQETIGKIAAALPLIFLIGFMIYYMWHLKASGKINEKLLAAQSDLVAETKRIADQQERQTVALEQIASAIATRSPS
ncbi:MAG TPA: hypothetical protein ENK83_00990 [Aliiroseovarius sp.]|nr:hypothetical protein [Aliiroseovarius sp.]